MKNLPVEIEVITPTHIGDGTKLTNWDYEVVNNSSLKVYSLEKILEEIAKTYPPQELERIAKTLKADIMNHPTDWCIGESTALRNVKKAPLYEVPLRIRDPLKQYNKRAQREEYKEIEAFIKSLGKVYIPGTEIKGALRTAVAYSILEYGQGEKIEQIRSWLIDEIEKLWKEIENIKRSVLSRQSGYIPFHQLVRLVKQAYKNRYRREPVADFKRIGDLLEKRIFQDINPQEADAKKDTLEVFEVADTDLKEPSQVLHIGELFLLNSSKPVRVYAELLNGGTKFSTLLQGDEYKLKALAEYWGVENPALDILKAAKGDYRYFIRTVLRIFTKDLLEEEIEYFSRPINRYPEPLRKRTLEKLNHLKGLLEKGKTLIRVGRYTGILTHTVDLYLYKNHFELFKKVYPYMVPRGYEDYPVKTRWVDRDGNPLGWLLLEF